MASITPWPFLFHMTTIFSRLTEYYSSNPEATPLNHLQKSTLGRTVARAWYGQSNRNQFKDALLMVKSEEDTGIFKVLSYPDYFSETIDKMIGDFYASMQPKKQRKRFRKPVWTSRP